MTEARDLLLRTDPRVLLTELDDGSGLLLHLRTKLYFTLNEQAVLVWKTLASEPCTASRLVDVLEATYDAPRAAIESDVRTLLDELLDDDLVSAD
jgi:hypothetical protein